jgi:single-strand DNA-binding protein
MNKVILSGRLTADPELRQTQSGIASCRFTIACDRKFADKNTGERQADFINCIAWRQTAEFVSRYFNKGKMIVVEGSLRTGSYTDKNHSDVTHYTTDVMVDNVEFAGDKGMNATGQASANPSTKDAPVVNDLSDYEEILSDGDVPF